MGRVGVNLASPRTMYCTTRLQSISGASNKTTVRLFGVWLNAHFYANNLVLTHILCIKCSQHYVCFPFYGLRSLRSASGRRHKHGQMINLHLGTKIVLRMQSVMMESV